MPATEELSGSSTSGSVIGEMESEEMGSPEGESVFGEQCFPQRQVRQMEIAWYTSPEEVATGESSFASDVYSLGVLMFEVRGSQYWTLVLWQGIRVCHFGSVSWFAMLMECGGADA